MFIELGPVKRGQNFDLLPSSFKLVSFINTFPVSALVRGGLTEASSSASGPVHVFEALDSDPALLKAIEAHSPVGRTIQLKVGAQVAGCAGPVEIAARWDV